MAKFLVKAVDNDADKCRLPEERCFKRGEIVDVFPDNHIFGTKECLPRFEVVVVAGLPINLLEYTTRKDDNRSLWCYDFDLQVFINRDTNEIRKLT